jgi:hypothetical protein
LSWRNRPTYKSNWPSGVDVIMFVDENGDSAIKNIQKNLKNKNEIEENNKFFTTTGSVIRKENFLKAKDDIITLKEKHWENGMYQYKGKLKRVCFHSHEIRKGKDAFSDNVIDKKTFMKDISDYMLNLEIEIFSATLNKEAHCRRYLDPDNPYDLCMNFILERFVKYYLGDDEEAIIILEARGKKEDSKLLNHIKSLIDNGTQYVSKNYFKKIKGVYFNPKWCKESDEKKSYFGLEIADLVSYPIHKYNTKGNKDRAFECIENKIYGFPNYTGKGIKKFPKK